MESVRVLRPVDLEAVESLSAAAGWNQTDDDWRRLLRLEPEGCFCLVADGTIVATSTLVRHGRELGWLGMVLTHPDHRGRGYGATITRAAMEYAWARGVRVQKLDATDMGHPLYTKLGFRDEQPIERWSAAPARLPRTAGSGGALPGLREADLDRKAFGADRAALLAQLEGPLSFTLPGRGYITARPGVHALQLGPCVALDRDAAATLVAAGLTRADAGMVYWDLLPANGHAAALAAEMGFAPARRLVRMSVRSGGADLAHDDELVYAAAGFEYG